MWSSYIQAARIEDVLEKLALYGSRARITAGATDLILELERGARKGVDVLLDVSQIAEFATITLDGSGWIHLGPLVTHNDCVASELLRVKAYPLARACWEVGSPQIRNRGTVVGNVVTGSPANDTITPLMALGAVITLRSVRGERSVPISTFYTGVRKTVMREDEMVVDIAFPAMSDAQKGIFIKYALRHSQAISLMNVAIILQFSEAIVNDAVITLGAVAPTIIHAVDAEKFLVGKQLDEETIQQAAQMTMQATRPIDDIRGSAKYRRVITRVITRRGLLALRDGIKEDGFPEAPVFLADINRNAFSGRESGRVFSENSPIETTINGKHYSISGCNQKTLLRMLREDVGLIGTKEGCSEGECGACTVLLDGAAVMSCMVPAPQAHGAHIRTIEGVGLEGQLHPVQTAFMKEGAVQCGYCTPGFVISAVKLLEEHSQPTKNQIEQALTGNLCRCTGYYKIIHAIEEAALQGGNNGKISDSGEGSIPSRT